jgi:hypothetical protein
MSEVHTPTRSRPYSKRPKILVVAENWKVLDALQKAFRVDAEYRTYDEALVGNRFEKVVVFAYHGGSRVEAAAIGSWIREAAPLLLHPGGFLVVVP